jgi:AcrR family transcriptional regulator
MTEQQSRYRERAERILDVAAELVLRWGYKRVTIEEIAKRADIGKGTVYLHWRTREALFMAILLRDSIDLIDELIQATWQDPAEILPHRQARRTFVGVMRRPLLRALFSRDMELLGELAHEKSVASVRIQKFDVATELYHLLRQHGLMRTDMDLEAQRYAVNAVTTGFYLVEPLAFGLPEPTLAAKAEAIAQTIRNAFEPSRRPDPEVLRMLAPKAIAMFEQVRESCLQRVHGDQTREGSP